MRIEFDIGNTNHKWRVLDGEAVISRGQFGNHDDGALRSLTSLIANYPIQQCWVSCVASQHFVVAIARWAREHFNVYAEQAVVSQESSGVRCVYAEPRRLGVDRWLVLLAAFHQYGASCVIDAGSATTVDVVDANGQQLGGYIVPGYDLLLRSLFNDTDKVKWLKSEETEDNALGDNTARAVTAGARLMLAGFVDKALSQLPKDKSFNVVFTGGGGLAMMSLSGKDGDYNPDIVFDGLPFCQREIVQCE